MTRPLLITAALGLVAAFACFLAAWTLGGGSLNHWILDIDSDEVLSGHPGAGGGPIVTRTLAWPGGDALTLALPADVTFTQGPDAKVVVTGPQGAANALELEDGKLTLNRPVHTAGRLKIAVTAPGVRSFNLMGSGDMRLDGLDQDGIDIRVLGSGDVHALGKAHRLDLNIAGSGDARLGELTVDSAEVHIAGSGDATVAPKDRLEANILGSGDVTLATDPGRVESNVVGSGRVIRPARPVTPAAPAPPAVSAKPTAPARPV